MARSYYNEIDPYAARWLENLIAAGHIAPGDVDTRSIEDVTPADIAGYTQCHFFAGIGVWSYALRLAGWPDDRPVWTGSCPCQPFSSAGKGGGFADERHLWPAWFHLISECRPDVVFGEQVASKDGLAWLDLVLSDLEAAEYACGAVDLCAAGVGAPHIRQRLYFVADAGHAGSPRAGGNSQRKGAELQPRYSVGKESTSASVVADAPRERRTRQHALLRPEAEGWLGTEAVPEVAGRGETGGLAESDKGQRLRGAGPSERNNSDRQDARRAEGNGCLAGGGKVGDVDGRRELGLPVGSRLEGQSGHEDDRGGPGRLDTEPGGPVASPGAVNGYWRGADWLACSDGKARPVEPGTFPLVNGAPARVGRLRAYGNAIVAPCAAEVVRAYLGS